MVSGMLRTKAGVKSGKNPRLRGIQKTLRKPKEEIART
jgi:hypothetical protein